MAGAGYKLFNTGDVLTAAQVNTYLMEQTVMVFADAAARTAALSGVVSEGMISYLKDTNAVEVYNGSAWVASDDPNAIQNTIVDAKGDLITATAADTPARLAVGNNGETLVADSSTSTGLRWQGSQAAGKNYVINGGMDIWQRSTSTTSGSAAYVSADRWATWINAGSGTLSRETASLPADFQYGFKFTSSASNSTCNFYHTIETANSVPLAGKTVVLSFWAMGTVGKSLSAEIRTSTSVDAAFTSSFTLQASGAATLTGTMTRYNVIATIPSTAKTIQVVFGAQAVAGVGYNSTEFVTFTGVQLELGSSPTAFTRAGGTIAGELAACQRYYWRQYAQSVSSRYGTGSFNNTTTAGNVFIQFPVTMRTNPSTTLEYSTLAVYDGVTVIAVTGAAADNTSTQGSNVAFTVASGGSAYRPVSLLANGSTSSYIGFTAEL